MIDENAAKSAISWRMVGRPLGVPTWKGRGDGEGREGGWGRQPVALLLCGETRSKPSSATSLENGDQRQGVAANSVAGNGFTRSSVRGVRCRAGMQGGRRHQHE